MNGLRVLVLDDDRDTNMLFATSLTKHGAEVRTAMSAADALRILESWRPAVILCDLHLPGVDGFGFLAQVRASSAYDNIPLIAISASHPDLAGERAVSAGFAERLAKPAKLKDVIEAIERVAA